LARVEGFQASFGALRNGEVPEKASLGVMLAIFALLVVGKSLTN
jgi:hypothetical protein